MKISTLIRFWATFPWFSRGCKDDPGRPSAASWLDSLAEPAGGEPFDPPQFWHGDPVEKPRVCRAELPFGLPADLVPGPVATEAAIVGWYFDPPTLTWTVYLEHESFPSLDDGSTIPAMSFEFLAEGKMTKPEIGVTVEMADVGARAVPTRGSP